MLKNRFHASHGFTLIETVVVMGVMAIILAGVWLLVGTVFEKAREHEANVQLQSMVRSIRQIYTRIGTFSNAPGTDYTALLDQQNAFPPEMKITPNTPDGKLNHPWRSGSSGSVTVSGGYPDTNGEATLFEIHYASLPKKACTFLAMHMPEGVLSNLIYIKIDSGSCYGSDPGCASALPISFITANTECRYGDNSSGSGMNDVIFRLSIR